MDNTELQNQYWRFIIFVEHIVRQFVMALKSWPEPMLQAKASHTGFESQYIQELDFVQVAVKIYRSLELCLSYNPVGSATMLYNLLIAFTACEEGYKECIAKVFVREITACLLSNCAVVDVSMIL